MGLLKIWHTTHPTLSWFSSSSRWPANVCLRLKNKNKKPTLRIFPELGVAKIKDIATTWKVGSLGRACVRAWVQAYLCSHISSAPSANDSPGWVCCLQEISPWFLPPNNGRFASSCLRFSHFQNTHTCIHSTRLLSSRLTLKTLLTFSGGGRPVASRSLWGCNPRHHKLFKACARELFFLSSPQKPCTHTHNMPLSVSPPQAEKNASWHVKQAYERGSHDSDHWIVGHKSRRQICNSSCHLLLSQMWFF